MDSEGQKHCNIVASSICSCGRGVHVQRHRNLIKKDYQNNYLTILCNFSDLTGIWKNIVFRLEKDSTGYGQDFDCYLLPKVSR